MPRGRSSSPRLHGQMGSSTRMSKTIGIELLYVAVPIPGGAVRMAYPLSAIREANRHIRSRSGGSVRGRGAAGPVARIRRDTIHRTPTASDHRFCRARRGRRSVGTNSGRVDRRDRARGLGARQDGAQAGRRISRGREQPPDPGDAAELHAGGGHCGVAGRARAVGQPAHGAFAAQRSPAGRAAGAVGARSRNSGVGQHAL